MTYDPKQIEPRWQEFWEKNKTFKTPDTSDKPKYYILDMFPYPSGAGLHVGHPEGYTATDIISRHKRMKGFNVLHPMGWDAFGLPAEEYAIQTGTHPRIVTQKNIDTFRRQIKAIGLSYDWDREVDTTDPKYFRWTQWIFSQLYKKGLAYIAEVPVNWCPALGTVLANEEIVDGLSERGGHPVIRKPMRQWVLKITAYADRLLEDLKLVDWPGSTMEMQKNWIGRSIGADVDFTVEGVNAKLRVFTTRPDTLFGATYMVLAPEHPLVDTITTKDQKKAVETYKNATARKSDLERTDLAKDKTGVFSGAYAVNPVNQQKIPIWIADYVLISYGTGAIMAVPAHDSRDWAFATKFNLPIIEVISGGNVQKEAHEGDGTLVNSRFLDGLNTDASKTKMTEWLEQKGLGKKAINYKLRDWLFSRQRYWGEPFPIIFVDGQPKLLPEEQLPLTLPDVAKYQPSGTGESPLATIDAWLNTTDPETGKPAKRETNTMPQWAGSCWYYLRYIDPKNEKQLVEPKKEKYWMPVDLYVGGAEHAVLHLLYSRFWHKVLFDIGVVSTPEPFMKLVHQGMILGENGEKMSKSRGNVINPDEVIADFGADTMRLYEMFMGPLEATKPWNTQGIRGVRRFLERAWRLYVTEDDQLNPMIKEVPSDEATLRALHKTIDKAGRDIEDLKFNTAISQMMIFVNFLTAPERSSQPYPKSVMESFALILSAFCPHIGEELWRRLGHSDTLAYEPWPKADPKWLKEDAIELPIQINGKLRDTLTVNPDISETDLKKMVLERPAVQKHLEGKSLKKFIYIQKRLVSLVV